MQMKMKRMKPYESIMVHFTSLLEFLFPDRTKNIDHWGNNIPTWLMLFLWDLNFNSLKLLLWCERALL